jgi:hypothetical protein
LNIDDLSLSEIESILNIKPMDPDFEKGNRVESKIMDSWSQVQLFIKRNDTRGCMYRSFNVLGYKLIQDNHLVEIFFTIDVFST